MNVICWTGKGKFKKIKINVKRKEGTFQNEVLSQTKYNVSKKKKLETKTQTFLIPD